MSFQTHEQNGLVWKTSDQLSGVRHGFSTRLGGVSPAPWDALNLGISRGDDMARVQENYRILCAALGMEPRRTVLSRQVHRNDIRLVTEADCGKGLYRPRDYDSVDAMLCQTLDIPLVVFSADCGIILLHDPVHAAVGAVHAGWRGAASGLVYQTVRRMEELFGTRPEELRAAIGAAIGPCCFETDEDVPQALRAALGDEAETYITRRDPKWYVDLKGVNAHWLRRAGVSAIDICPDCTACRQDLYWSHRRVGQARGAQAALICL